MERIPEPALGTNRGDGLLHRRSVDPDRFAAIPCSLLHGSIDKESGDRRHRSRAVNGLWMSQIARNLTDAGDGILTGKRFLIHDRDPLFTTEFLSTLAAAGVKSAKLPPRSPNLNAYAERFVRSVKESCLDRMILFGEGSLRTAVHNFVAHYHTERNHQGLENRLINPEVSHLRNTGRIQRSRRLGGMLNYYHRTAA